MALRGTSSTTRRWGGLDEPPADALAARLEGRTIADLARSLEPDDDGPGPYVDGDANAVEIAAVMAAATCPWSPWWTPVSSGCRHGQPTDPVRTEMTTIAWVAVAIFVGAYVLIATERVHRVAASLGGAAIILGLG